MRHTWSRYQLTSGIQCTVCVCVCVCVCMYGTYSTKCNLHNNRGGVVYLIIGPQKSPGRKSCVEENKGGLLFNLLPTVSHAICYAINSN